MQPAVVVSRTVVFILLSCLLSCSTLDPQFNPEHASIYHTGAWHCDPRKPCLSWMYRGRNPEETHVKISAINNQRINHWFSDWTSLQPGEHRFQYTCARRGTHYKDVEAEIVASLKKNTCYQLVLAAAEFDFIEGQRAERILDRHDIDRDGITNEYVYVGVPTANRTGQWSCQAKVVERACQIE